MLKLLRYTLHELGLTEKPHMGFQLLKIYSIKNEFLMPKIVHMWELREELIE